MAEWNPRYIQYALAHGQSPSKMLNADSKRWPGGTMTGFILWISDRKQEFKVACPESVWDGRIVDENGWDRFLENRSKELRQLHEE